MPRRLRRRCMVLLPEFHQQVAGGVSRGEGFTAEGAEKCRGDRGEVQWFCYPSFISRLPAAFRARAVKTLPQRARRNAAEIAEEVHGSATRVSSAGSTDGQRKWVIDNRVSPSGMPARKGILNDKKSGRLSATSAMHRRSISGRASAYGGSDRASPSESYSVLSPPARS